MAADIQNVVTSSTVIRNGSAVVFASVQGAVEKLTTPAVTIPVIGDIDDKYDTRFDDIAYYI